MPIAIPFLSLDLVWFFFLSFPSLLFCFPLIFEPFATDVFSGFFDFVPLISEALGRTFRGVPERLPFWLGGAEPGPRGLDSGTCEGGRSCGMTNVARRSQFSRVTCLTHPGDFGDLSVVRASTQFETAYVWDVACRPFPAICRWCTSTSLTPISVFPSRHLDPTRVVPLGCSDWT